MKPKTYAETIAELLREWATDLDGKKVRRRRSKGEKSEQATAAATTDPAEQYNSIIAIAWSTATLHAAAPDILPEDILLKREARDRALQLARRRYHPDRVNTDPEKKAEHEHKTLDMVAAFDALQKLLPL